MGNRSTANQQKKREEIEQKSCQNQPKIDEKWTWKGPRRPQEQLWSDRRAKKSKKEAERSILGAPRGCPGDAKFMKKRIEKTIKKRYLPKTTFFHNLSAFPGFRRRFSSILDPKMDARTVIFWWFFGTVFSRRFFVIFVRKKKKREIWKSSFRIIKYGVSWGSPCWKKQATMRKKRIVFFIDFSSIFHDKSMNNRAKHVKTRHVHKNRQKDT